MMHIRNAISTPLTFFLFFAVILLFSSQARALTYFSEDDAVVTGIVTEVGTRTFSLDSGTIQFDISLDDLDLDTNITTFLTPGSRVAVRGVMADRAFGNPTIEARRMLMVDSNLSEVDATQMLLYNPNRTNIHRLD